MIVCPICKNIFKTDITLKKHLNKKYKCTNINDIITTKTCSVCKIIKDLSEFTKDKTKLYGVNNRCKTCKYKEDKIYRDEIKNKEKSTFYNKNYYEINKEKYKLNGQKYREQNKDILKIKKKEYTTNNKEKINFYFKNKYKTDIKHKLKCNIRCRLYAIMKINNIVKKSSIILTIGLSIELFHKWIEWNCELDNIEDDIHLDHFIPLSNFNLIKKDSIPNTSEKFKMNLRIKIFMLRHKL
jgi:hypothetical protein